MNLEAEDISLRERDEIQAMLGKNPGCWVSYSIPILFGITLVLLGLSWFVQYPDRIDVAVTLTSEYPPVRVPARTAGRLSVLAVRDGDAVEPGQILAELESGAEGAAVRRLKNYATQMESAGNPEAALAVPVPANLALGVLQSGSSALWHAHKNLQIELQQDIVHQQIDALENEKAETRSLIESLQRQESILAQDFALAEKDLDRQRQLLAQGLVSAQEFDKAQSAFLRQKQQLESFTTNVNVQRVKIRQLETRQSELNHDRRRQVLLQWATLRQEALRTLGEIDQWELQYLIKAPLAGRLAFSAPLVEQQFVPSGQELFSIVPPGGQGGRIVALGALPQAGSGKVEVGQKVNIRLDGFPYPEFGVLEGRVRSISPLPSGDHYLLHIDLPGGLQTSARKTLPFQPDARGQGQIITKKRSLLERAFQQFFALVEE